MAAPIALQLYTLREAAATDFEGVVRRVAEIGYAGVEPAGFPGSNPEAAGKLFKELGLQVPSMHGKFPVGDDKNEVFDTMNAIGTKRVISGRGPSEWDTMDKVKANCAMINEAAANAAEHGFTVGYHNHWWEFATVDGQLVYDIMQAELDPSVFFQVDTYWVKVGGSDVVSVLKKLGSRAPVLHIKDGPADDSKSDMTAVGAGVLNWHEIIPAVADTTEWLIVELDRCATDMFAAVEDSLKYLTSEGLASGK